MMLNDLQPRRRPEARQRGAGALLAMMFLVIFASLATAMAIVSQGNLRTADSHLKATRALAAAETGLHFAVYRIQEVLRQNNAQFSIATGVIDDDLAKALWAGGAVEGTNIAGLRQEIADAFAGDTHDADPRVDSHGVLLIGPISLGGGAPRFSIALAQHPIPATAAADEGHPFYGHSYDSPFYARPPYDGSRPETGMGDVSSASPLDERWVRMKVTSIDGPVDPDNPSLPIDADGRRSVVRSISMDFRIDKKIKAAILSKSRVMIGRNVMIEGRIGSKFMDVDFENGHPVQMESDFRGLDSELDDALDVLREDLTAYDVDDDNRLRWAVEVPPEQREAAKALDVSGDGYLDDFDLFLDKYDSNGDGRVSRVELAADSDINAGQLFELIDTFGSGPGEPPASWTGDPEAYPGRFGFEDGFIDASDRYAKVRGEVVIAASKEDWESGAADGDYRDYFSGPIHPDHNEAPLTFSADEQQFPEFDQKNFGVEKYWENVEGNDVVSQASSGQPAEAVFNPDGPMEPVPFAAKYPYDYYKRPVFSNMTFENVFIPKGTNALFENCTFKGVTYIEVHTDNSKDDWAHPTDPTQNAFNYAGMQEADGTPKHPDIDAAVEDDLPAGTQPGTKRLGNNIRFHSCKFYGPVVSGGHGGAGMAQPDDFSHTRNKLTFTGETDFIPPDKVTGLSDEQRDLYRRGTIVTPHMSIEMGSFIDPYSSSETVELSGAVVAGILDMRGQVKLDGTILTTFEPVVGEGPVLGETTPQFNTTLGYFSSADGDLESEMPDTGIGVIQVRYNPSLPLPDGVVARISMEPVTISYTEGGLDEPREADPDSVD